MYAQSQDTTWGRTIHMDLINSGLIDLISEIRKI